MTWFATLMAQVRRSSAALASQRAFLASRRRNLPKIQPASVHCDASGGGARSNAVRQAQGRVTRHPASDGAGMFALAAAWTRPKRHSGNPSWKRGEVEEGSEVVRVAVVSGGNAAELLKPVHSPLDQIALPAEYWVKRAGTCAAGACRDDGFGAGGFNDIKKRPTIITLVANHFARCEASDQIACLCDIADLTCCDNEAHRSAKAVDGKMDSVTVPLLGSFAKIRSSATFDFCNEICQKLNSAPSSATSTSASSDTVNAADLEHRTTEFDDLGA